jgi:hypothetical protein
MKQLPLAADFQKQPETLSESAYTIEFRGSYVGTSDGKFLSLRFQQLRCRVGGGSGNRSV